ncbi:MAG: transcriptional repressor LexA [Acidobacteria bacterium]|nr:transcriptional repressor LexA [Acidobacteriota bacterium]
MYLTPTRKAIYEYIKNYILQHEIAPSYEEIRKRFGFHSTHSVHRHIQQLEIQGLIQRPAGGRKRALQIVGHTAGLVGRSTSSQNAGAQAVTLPLLGTVAAGRPIDAIVNTETIDVPDELIGRGEHFALRVKGDSMIDDGICDGDVLIINQQFAAENGQTVIALINNEATVKRFFRRGTRVELRPSNPSMKSIFVKADELRVQGIVVGLLRKFQRG